MMMMLKRLLRRLVWSGGRWREGEEAHSLLPGSSRTPGVVDSTLVLAWNMDTKQLVKTIRLL
jgi:hypothetical protein